MADIKDRYSDGVYTRKIEALNDPELGSIIARGIARAAKRKKDWQAVDINEVVAKFAPNAEPEYHGGKIEFVNADRTIGVVADVGGGYLRIENKNYTTDSDRYLDLDGNLVTMFRNKKGVLKPVDNDMLMKLTHFRIKKREEMQI